MMHLARLPLPGSALALLTETRRAAFRTLVLPMTALIALSCSNEPTDPPGDAPVRAPMALAVVGCEGCRRDPFIAPEGTLLENRLWGGDGASFAWVKTFGPTAFPDPAVIQNDAVGKTGEGFWRYITNALGADSIEIEVDVLGDIASQAIQYDIGVVLRNTSPDSGGFGGYTIFWSAYGNGAGAADAFITIDRPDANLLYEENVPVPTPGTHTLGVAALAGGAIKVYVDGVLTATAVDPAPLPPGNAGLTFGWVGAPPSRVWITTFAEGLHQRDSMTVKLERDDDPVWPLGTLGAEANEVELRVSVLSNDTTVKDKWVQLSIAAVDSSGTGSDESYGHYHTGAGGAPKPAGTLSKDSVTTGSGGTGVVRYTSSPVSGPVVVRAEAPGSRPASLTIAVGVPELVQLVEGPTFDTVGVKAIHRSSHWVTTGMRSRLLQLADSFHSRYGAKLGFNDASLPFGGKFDIHRQWAGDDPECLALGGNLNGCHAGHRVGLDIDLRTNNLTAVQVKAAKEFWETISGREIFPHIDHFHLPYRPRP